MDTYTQFTHVDHNHFVTIVLSLFMIGSMAAVFYWAATIENNIENNPDK
ncbi:MAG: hypothetical protein OEM38_09770 [Gammaproteobacteria bacterium]|nr:hypothetical protein [Gammaproteobacteria bacterium]